MTINKWSRKHLYIIILLLGALASRMSWGQSAGDSSSAPAGGEDHSTKRIVFKGKAPVSHAPFKVVLPRVQEITLNNGLRVVLLESHKVPTVSLELIVQSGGLSDPPDHRGLAHFTALLLREGTTHRKSKVISEQMESLGMTLAAESGLASYTSHVRAFGLAKNLDGVIELFADVVCHASFSDDEVGRLKATMQAQWDIQRATPKFLLQEMDQQVIYGAHPASLFIPPLEALQKITSESLKQFHAQHYRPNNAILMMAGDATLADLLSKLNRAFRDWKAAPVPKTPDFPAPQPHSATVNLIDRPGSVQTSFHITYLALGRTNPDYVPLQVVNKILGAGPGSRLSRNLRDDKGYTYGLFSSFTETRFRGLWNVVGAFRTEVTGAALQEFRTEFKRIRTEKVSPEELADAKRSLVGSFAVALQEPQAMLQNIITQKLYDLPADYWETYPQKVEAVSAEDVQRVARKYLDPAFEHINLVGDASKIAAVVARFGPVRLYNTDGKPIKAVEAKSAKNLTH